MALFVYRILTVLHICCSLRRLKTRPPFTPFSGRTVSSVTVQCNHHISARAVDYFWQQCVFCFCSLVSFDVFFFFFFFFSSVPCVCVPRSMCVRSMMEPSQEDIGNRFGYQKRSAVLLCARAFSRGVPSRFAPYTLQTAKIPSCCRTFCQHAYFKKKKKALAKKPFVLLFPCLLYNHHTRSHMHSCFLSKTLK